MRLRDDLASKIFGLTKNTGKTTSTVTSRDSSRLSLGRSSRIAVPMVRFRNDNKELVEAKSAGHTVYADYKDTEAIKAVEGEPDLTLSATEVILGADQDILSSIITLQFGSPIQANELAYMGSVSGTGSGTLLQNAHDVAFTNDNHVMVSSRGSDNAVTAWELLKARYSKFMGAVRGSGSPNFMDDGVVCRTHPTKEWVAYAAYTDNAVHIVDVSDPTAPKIIGTARGTAGEDGYYLNRPHSLIFYEDWLVVVSGEDASLSILDASDPSSDTWMGCLGELHGAHGTGGLYLYGVSDVAVKQIGSYIYAFTCSRQDGNLDSPTDVDKAGCLQCFDITDPPTMSLVGAVYSSDAPYDETGSYELEGGTGIVIDTTNMVYISTRWQNRAIQTYDSGLAIGSLTIFDVSNPATPVFKGCIAGRGTGATVGSYPNGIYLGEAHWVSKWGDICVVSSFSDDCITLIDVTDPTLPTQISHAGTAADYCNGPVGNCISSDGNLVYVACWWSSAFLIFDISTPATPVRIGGKTGIGYPYYLEGAHGICLSADDSYVYVSSRKSDDALTVWTTEDGVRLETTYVGYYTNAGMMGPVRIEVDGNYCYVAARDSNRILKLNIATKSSIYNGGSISGAGSPNYLSQPNHILKSGSYLYVASGGDNAMVILNDVAGDNNPTLAGVYTNATYCNGAMSVQVNSAGTRAYVAAFGGSRITVLDISTKSAPAYLNSVTGNGEPYYLNGIRDLLLLDDQYLLGASSNDDCVVLYDVSAVDATNAPRLVAVFQGAGAPKYCDRPYGLALYDADTVLVASYTDNSINQLTIDEEKFTRDNVIFGSSFYLTGAANLAVGTAHGKIFIASAAYTDNAFSVFKVSEILTDREAGIRSNFGQIEVKSAFGDWTKI